MSNGACYTFFCIGKREGQPRQARVGFAVRSSMLQYIQQSPIGISPRLMKLQLRLRSGLTAVLISAYDCNWGQEGSFLWQPERRNQISSVCKRVRQDKHKLFILGDFNARVGRDYSTWPRVLGHHSVGNENSNGSLVLQTCNQNELAITNTYFQQANKYKTTWQHPRSKHWHMLCSAMSSLVTETLRRCILPELCVVLAAGRIIALCAVWSISVCVVHAVIAPSDAGG